ncbi:hypothetical protein HK101_007463 [Irineochytrium annulatum]|nr:hypothetical protein HK101_007463 [Irineochytrium annulatum]
MSTASFFPIHAQDSGAGETTILYVRAQFESERYCVVATDLKQFWKEDIGRERIKEKIHTHAKGYARNELKPFLNIYIRSLVSSPNPSFKYSLTSTYDTMFLRIKGNIKGLDITWVFDMTATEPGDHHGSLLTQIILPTMANAVHAYESIGKLEALLMKKDKEIAELKELLAMKGGKYLRILTPPYDPSEARRERHSVITSTFFVSIFLGIDAGHLLQTFLDCPDAEKTLPAKYFSGEVGELHDVAISNVSGEATLDFNANADDDPLNSDYLDQSASINTPAHESDRSHGYTTPTHTQQTQQTQGTPTSQKGLSKEAKAEAEARILEEIKAEAELRKLQPAKKKKKKII